MPFMLNGTAMNKPMLNGAILNCLHGGRHVWLQNQWTGPADASTSTLSQDGTVVAKNLFTNPGFDANGSQPAITKNIASGSMSDGVLTLTRVSGRTDAYWQWTLTGLPAGTPMVASCSMTNGKLMAWSSSWAGLSPWSFTVPDDGVARFAFAPTGDSTATFTRPLLCTAADYAAMQALGVTSFNGYTYTRQRKG